MESSKIKFGRLIGWLVFAMCLAGVLGNVLYPFMMEVASPRGTAALIATSANEPFTHRALSVLFFSLTGAAVVVTATLYSSLSPEKPIWPVLIASLGTGIGVLVLGLVIISKQLASVGGVTPGMDASGALLPISAIPLPFMIAVAGVAVLMVGCALSLTARRKRLAR